MVESSPADEGTRAQPRGSPKRAHGNDIPSPPPKRQRVYVACEICRVRKQKCDSKRPSCSTCIATGQQCVYGAGVKKRGLPPGYVRVLETLLGLIFSKIANSEDAVAALLLNTGVVTRQWALGKHDDGNDAVLQRFKKSHVCKRIERLLEGEARDSSATSIPPIPAMSDDVLDQQDWKEHHSNGTDNLLESRQIALPLSSVDPKDARPGSDKLPATAFALAAGFLHLPLESRASLCVALLSASPAWLRANAMSKSLVNLQLPSNTWTLLDIYFTWTNCWLPIVQRQEILKTFHSYESTTVQLDLNCPHAGKHAVLWAVLAHASFQEHSSASKDLGVTGDILSCCQLYQTARSLVPVDLPSHESGHVQALIILALINCGRGQSTIARELIGQAIRVGDQLGLGLDSYSRRQHNGNFGAIYKDDGIMTGCLIIDTLLSVSLNKPSQLEEQALSGVGTMDTDRLDEYEPWFDRTKLLGSSSSDIRRGPQYSFTVFNQLTKVVQLLHSYHRSGALSGAALQEYRNNILDELRSWKPNLPSTCQLSTPLNGAQRMHVTPQLLNLHIIHQFIVMHCMGGSDANLESAVPAPYGALSADTDSKLPSLLLVYADIFGCIAMPSTYSQITKSTWHWQGLLQPSLPGLQDILTKIHCTWEVHEALMPVIPDDIRGAIDSASKKSAYFLPVHRDVPESHEKPDALPQHSTPTIRSSYTPQNSNPPPRNEDLLSDVIPAQQNLSHQRTAIPHQSPTNDIHTTTHAHMTIPEDALHPISPMSIDNTFKRPEHPASASARVFGADLLHPHNSYHPQMSAFGHVSEDFANQNRTQQQQSIYDPQFSTPYNSASGVIGSQSLLSSNYDLDQLFNDLAPLDQGDINSAFMMNLGISGDPGFDLDAFFA